MEITFVQWVLQTIPETLVTAALVLALAGQRLEVKKVFFIGLLAALITFGVRLLPISFGVHTIVIIVSYAVLLNLVVKLKFSRCLFYALMALVALGVFETIFTLLLINITGLTIEYFMADTTLRIIAGWPQIIILYLLALTLRKWRAQGIFS